MTHPGSPDDQRRGPNEGPPGPRSEGNNQPPPSYPPSPYQNPQQPPPAQQYPPGQQYPPAQNYPPDQQYPPAQQYPPGYGPPGQTPPSPSPGPCAEKPSHKTRNLLVGAVVLVLIAAGAVAFVTHHKGKSTPSAAVPKISGAAAGALPSAATSPSSAAGSNLSSTPSDGDSDLSAAISSALAGAPLPGTSSGSVETGKPLPVTAGQWRLDSVTVSADSDSGEYEGSFNVTYLGQGPLPSGTLFTVGLFVNGKDVGELDGGGSQSSSGNQETIEVFSSDKFVAGPYTYYFYAG